MKRPHASSNGDHGRRVRIPRAPTCSDPQDGPGSHFPNPKVVTKLKRLALEKYYLLPAKYSFVIPEPDATMNELPAECVAVYWAALNHCLRFPLHYVIREILNKYGLAPAQIVPTSWHYISSFIVTCELRSLTCSGQAFGLVHTKQGFMTAIEKKSKLKY